MNAGQMRKQKRGETCLLACAGSHADTSAQSHPRATGATRGACVDASANTSGAGRTRALRPHSNTGGGPAGSAVTRGAFASCGGSIRARPGLRGPITTAHRTGRVAARIRVHRRLGHTGYTRPRRGADCALSTCRASHTTHDIRERAEREQSAHGRHQKHRPEFHVASPLVDARHHSKWMRMASEAKRIRGPPLCPCKAPESATNPVARLARNAAQQEAQ